MKKNMNIVKYFQNLNEEEGKDNSEILIREELKEENNNFPSDNLPYQMPPLLNFPKFPTIKSEIVGSEDE